MNILLVIDMQSAWLANPARPCHASAAVVERINQAGAIMRRTGVRVIFVQHANEEAIPGSAPWQILPALARDAADVTVFKRACDAFAGTTLAAELAALEGDTLFVCGFATEFCVDTTVRVAASRAMNIVVLGDAHTTSNRPHLDAASIIAHHNWVWSNMAVLPDSSLAVLDTASAMSQL